MTDWLKAMSDPHYLALAVSVCTTACAQILMKTGARNKERFVHSLMNPVTISGYALLLISTFLVAYAMQTVDMKTAAMWAAIPYMLVLLLARMLLKERVSKQKMAGCALIITGLAIFHLS